MRILFFSTYYLPYISGMTTHAAHILKHWSQKHEVRVLTFPYRSDLPSTETHTGVQITRMPYLLKISKGFISPQSIAAFWRESAKTDTVVLNIPNFEGFLLALIAKIRRKKLLAVYCCEVYLGEKIWQRLTCFILNCSVFIQLLLSDQIIGISEDYAKNRWVYSWFKNKMHFIHPVITERTSKPTKLAEYVQLKKGWVWIGYVGRISREKGIENLVTAVAQLPQKDSIQLIFAGPFGKDVPGEEEYYHEIKDKLDRAEINYLFLGYVADEDIGALYQSLDLFILPSVNRTEAFGIVQVEAMELGVPVIASNSPGIRDAIIITGMGKLIEPYNTPQLSETIIEILRNKQKYVSAERIAHTRDYFSPAKVLAFYDSILEMLNKTA